MKRSAGGLLAFFMLVFASAGLADDLRKTEKFSGTLLAFDFAAPYSNATLTVTGPNGFYARAVSKAGAPTLDLQKFGAVADGSYTYQLTASSERPIAASSAYDNGRDGKVVAALAGMATSGTFRVKDGVILPRAAAKEPSRRDRP